MANKSWTVCALQIMNILISLYFYEEPGVSEKNTLLTYLCIYLLTFFMYLHKPDLPHSQLYLNKLQLSLGHELIESHSKNKIP